ncbi:MAG: DUF5674 family protein [Candidatus Cryptobacteroides sp.]
MLIIDDIISNAVVSDMAKVLYGDMIKAVADIKNGYLAIDAELHSDLEGLLLKKGSLQEDLWGFNIYPDMFGEEDYVEFDSLINIKPRQNNMSRDVEDATIRQRIMDIVYSHIK